MLERIYDLRVNQVLSFHPALVLVPAGFAGGCAKWLALLKHKFCRDFSRPIQQNMPRGTASWE